MKEFQLLIDENKKWFEGVNPETEVQLSNYEKQLGFPLPNSLKWLLSNYGYSTSCGIDNLKESIQKTLELRETIELPRNILLINDWGDAGLVFFITNDSFNFEYEVFWSNTSDIYNLIQGQPLSKEADQYINYPAWVLDRFEDEKEESKY